MVNLSLIFCCLSLMLIAGNIMAKDLEKSLQKAHCLEQNYLEMGYEIIHIHPGSVEERTKLIIDYITKWGDKRQQKLPAHFYSASN